MLWRQSSAHLAQYSRYSVTPRLQHTFSWRVLGSSLTRQLPGKRVMKVASSRSCRNIHTLTILNPNTIYNIATPNARTLQFLRLFNRSATLASRSITRSAFLRRFTSLAHQSSPPPLLAGRRSCVVMAPKQATLGYVKSKQHTIGCVFGSRWEETRRCW